MDYGAFDGFSILELPCLMAMGKGGNSFSMYIFLPDERDRLPKLIQKMGSDLAFLNQKFELKREEFEYLYLPKFRFSYSFKPHAILKQLGHGFELGGQKSTMIRKVSIDVNEVGTEAAAAAVFIGMGCGLPDPKVKFLADHPFLFMVKEEKSRHVLFVGAVLDP
ncbi:hypothetical protein Droror1_Dr00007417 [Drosera rotundifolia]